MAMNTTQHLAIIDSIPGPTNSNLNPIVNHLLKDEFSYCENSTEGRRLARAALRLRARYLRNSSGKILAFHQKTSLSGWLTMQTSRYNAN